LDSRNDSDPGENLLKEVFASIQDGISILDRDLNIIRVNAKMEEWYADSAPIAGKKCYEAYHGADKPCCPCPTIRCMETGQTESEIIPGPADSPVRWIELYSHPMKNPETGEITGIAEFVRDITARVTTQEEIRLLADQAQTTFDAMSDAVLLMDREARIVRCNSAAIDFIGRSVDRIIGMKCHEVVHCEPDHIPECPFMKMMESGQSESLLMTKDERWFDSRVDPVRSVSGDIEGAVHIFRDITDMKTLEKRLLFLTKLLSQLPLTGNRRQIIRHILLDIQEHSGIEATGLRLSDGEDFPYYEAMGFGSGFIESEKPLCERDASGDTVTGPDGVPVLECMCGNVMRGTVDQGWDCITERGAFWTNSLSDFLKAAPESQRHLVTRKGCIGEGYESLALIPLKSGLGIIGLLQLSDHRKDFFTPEIIDFFENISSALGVALARSLDAEKWKSLTEDSPDHIMLLDRSGRIRFINRTVPWLSVEEVIGRHINDFTLPTTWEVAEHAMNQVLETGKPATYMTEYKADDGEIRYFEVRLGPVWDSGQIEALVSTSTDVTDRKRIEIALLQSEERLNLALSGTAGALWDCPDVTSDQEWWSPEYYQLMGYLNGEIEANRQTFISFLHPDDREVVSSAIVGSLESNDSFDIEFRLKLKSGDYRWLRSRARINRDEGGKPVRVTGVATDVNERKLIELALVKSEESYRSIFNSVYSAILVHDAETSTLLDVNEPACKLFGLTREELLKTPPGEFARNLTGHNLEEVQEKIRLAASGESQQLEGSVQTSDGQDRWVHAYLQKAVVGGESRVLAIVRDITELKKAEEEKKRLEVKVQHAQKLESLGILAGGIAHDFNNILVGILGNADLALMDLAPEHPAYDSLKDIETASKRASELVRQMLAYSGKGKFQVDQININRIIEDMTHMLRMAISKKATLGFDLAEDLPLVEGDATQIRQILMNLVINASESIEKENGLVTVRTSSRACDREYLRESYLDENLEDGLYCCIEVSDTGSGIDPEIRSQLFDPFFTTKLTGRGLGLAAVLGIVRGHNGAIRVYSESGKGTTFSILLPASDRQQDNAGLPEQSGDLSDDWEASGTVLLVDDEDSVLQVGKRMLVRHGFEVISACDGREAIEVYRKYHDQIVCVVLDLTMPRMDGIETMNKLMKLDDSVRVVLCSGYSESEVSHRFPGRGFASFVQKPYSSHELMETIRKVIET
jgi:two-component system cell cycle sensor histidine kinase/response regulator CckA